MAYVILLILGFVMLSSYLTEKFALLTSRLSNVGSQAQAANNVQGGFISGVLFGAMVGIVWTPCVGPILAAVIVQAAIQQTQIGSVGIAIAFALGAGVPMLIIAIAGRYAVSHLGFFRTRTEFFRKLLGIIIIFSVIFLMFATNITSSVANTNDNPVLSGDLLNGLSQPYPAPPIVGIDAWINSPPLQLADLKGKVVLIDFWTYSCINCIRTLPYIKDWYAKYHDKGLVIIGVHTPEFEFEKNLDNVKNAVKAFNILYPVALDSHYATWKSFQNQYWPAHFLIDKAGNIVYEHFGEGDYAITEHNIRYLLGL